MAWVPGAPEAIAGRGAEDSTRTHDEFIQQSLRQFALAVVQELDSAHAHEFRVAPAHPDSANRWIETALASLSVHLMADAPVVSYHVRACQLSLVRKTRRLLLGRSRVLRELHLQVGIDYPPGSTRTGIEHAEYERTYQDWLRAADVADLNTGEFSSLVIPPASDFVSRWAAPVAVSMGLGLITYLFFSVR